MAVLDRNLSTEEDYTLGRIVLSRTENMLPGRALTFFCVALFCPRQGHVSGPASLLEVGFLQSQDRIHRLSQRSACEISLLTARGSIDGSSISASAKSIDLFVIRKATVTKSVRADLALRMPDLLRALIEPAE
jgi:hypothetical protein